jgi:hypothetical protein
MNKTLTVILILLLTSCGPYWYKPYGRIFDDRPRGGTPGFNLGWNHGCESGMSGNFGGAFYQTFYNYRKDPDIMSSSPNLEKIRNRYKKELPINWNNSEEISKNLSDYKKIFPAAYAYCKHSVLGMLQSANMTPPNAGDSEARWDPSRSNLENIYRIDGRGDARWSLW